MAKQLMYVIGLGVLSGVAAEVLRGERVGIAFGLFVAVLGAIGVVLVRNQRDCTSFSTGRRPRRARSAADGAEVQPAGTG